MDADCGVELRLGHAALDGNCDTLSDLSSAWRQYVVADDSQVVQLIANDLDIARFAVRAELVELPFQRLEGSVIARDVLCSELGLGVRL